MPETPHTTSRFQPCAGNHPDREDIPWAEIGYLCHECYGWLRDRLLELPAITHWLEVFIAATGGASERVTGSREDPIPLRQDVLDLIGPDSRHYVTGDTPPVVLLWGDGLMIGAYATWAAAAETCHAEMLNAGVSRPAADLFRQNAPTDEQPAELLEELAIARTRWQLRPTERGGADQAGEDSILATLFVWSRLTEADGKFTDWPTTPDVTSFAGFLAGHLSWIALQPWVEEFVVDVRTLGWQAHRLAPWRAEIRRDPDPCTRCGAKAVVLHIAAGESRCEKKAGGCDRRQPLSEYVLNAVLPETRRTG